MQAQGSYRELGRAVGEGAREQIAAALAFYEDNFVSMSGISFADAELRAHVLLPFAQRHLPQYVEELEGVAEGAAQPFARLLVPNCAEEFTCPVDAGPDQPPAAGPAARGPAPVSRGCTAAAVMDGGRRLVGHNMDWYIVDSDKNVLFDLTSEDGTRLVTLAGAPYLPILGMNSHGVAYVGNSLYSNDDRAGVPNVFVRRWVLEARSLEEAVARACLPARAHGSNHLLGDRQGRLWDLETSATAAAVTRHERLAAHTNHYEAPAMSEFEGYHWDESRRRLRRAEAMLRDGLGRGDDPLDVVTGVLRSHEDAPDAICGHPDAVLPLGQQNATVASMICDLDAMRLLACAGQPCENPYVTFDVSR